MAHFVTRVETSMSPEEAFDYMADLRNYPDWDPGVSSAVMVGDGEIGAGTAFDLAASGAELRYVLVEFDRPRKLVADADGARLRSYDVIEIEPTEGGSIVTYDATVTLKGIYKVFSPILALMFDRIGAKADEGLQATLPSAVKVS